MSMELPKGWAETNIGEISDRIHYGYTAKSEKKPIGTKLLRITDIQNNKVNWDEVPYCKISDSDKKKYLLEPNDLVFARTGATVGKSYLIPQIIPESVFASYLIRVVLNSNISPKYIYNFFQSPSYWIQIKEGSAGIGQPNVNATKLSKIKLPIPPLPEQNRIVSKIEELFTRLDSGIESLKQVQKLLIRYHQSVLKSSAEGKLTSKWHEEHEDELEPADKLLEHILKKRKEKWEAEQLANFKAKGKSPPENWQNKYIEPTPPDTSNLPELPKGWLWVKSDQLFSYVTSGSRGWKKYYSDTGANFIRTQDINTNRLRLEEVAKVLLPEKVEGKRSLVKQWDLLGIITGANFGKVALVTEPIEESYVSQSVVLIRLAETKISKYLHLNMISEDNGSTQLQKLAYGMGRPVLNLQNVRDLDLPLPPLEEQDKIVEQVERHFSIIDEAEKAVESELKRSQSLRKSILKRAFEGKLVPCRSPV